MTNPSKPSSMSSKSSSKSSGKRSAKTSAKHTQAPTPEQALENTHRLLEQRKGVSRTPATLQGPDGPATDLREVSGDDAQRAPGPQQDKGDPAWPPLPRDELGRGGGRHH